MHQRPKVSIIVPVYNAEKYLRKCLDSLIAQSLKDIEIICVEDCSPDNSMLILNEYAKREPRIKILQNKRNLGTSGTINVGLRAAKADYIMFCGCDDFYNQQICLKLYNAITGCDCEMAICGTNIIYEDDSVLYYRKVDKHYFAHKYRGLTKCSDEVVLNVDVCLWNKIFKREIIEAQKIIFPKGLIFEDAYFLFCYTRFCKSILFIEDKLYTYVRRKNSVTANLIKNKISISNRAKNYLYVTKRFYDFLFDRNIFETNKNLFFKIFRIYFWIAFNISHGKERNYIIDECVDFFDKNNLMHFKDGERIIKEVQYRQKKSYPIKKLCVNLLCASIPFRETRRSLRQKLMALIF
jgi:glycosyltransferase involved in cell wall biosynthesis